MYELNYKLYYYYYYKNMWISSTNSLFSNLENQEDIDFIMGFKIISLFTIMEDYNSSDIDKEKEQGNENSNEYNYYKGRVKRPKDWRKLHNYVFDSLNKTTVLIFLIWFYEDLQEFLKQKEIEFQVI